MPAFQFPDPTVQTTVKNPITGSTYQWKADPGKWVMTVSIREVGDIIWEGDAPPNPIGDYKLWYSTDTLELYFYYCDANGVCAWLPTSVPIQVLEDLNAFAAQAEVDIDQLQYKQTLLQNALDQIYLDLQTNSSVRPPIFSDTEPTVHPDFTAPDNGLETGDTWFDTTDPEQLIEYVYNKTEWVLTGNYVKKAGDTMTGELKIDDAKLTLTNSPLDFVQSAESLKDTNGDPDLNASGEEQWDPSAERFAKIESLPPRLLRSDGTYGGDTTSAFGIRVEIDDGNTFKNQFKVGNRNGDAVTIAGGTGPAVTFGSGFPGNQDKVAPGDEGKVMIKGIPTPDYDTAEGDVAVNKRYVDERDEVLRQDIIELEEEIDAIAPSVERGKWRFTAVGTVANPGQFTMYDAEFGSGNPTGLFKSAKSIWFNEVDTDGVTHAFGDVDDGELLEIFVEGAPEYGLYEVVGQAHDETVGATSFWVIDVNFVRTIEDTAAVAPNEVCRFKVFMAPTGGDASGFVMKSGDTMSGQLKFYTEQADDSFDYRLPTDGSKDIRFTTKRLDTGFENTTSLYKPGYTDTLVCSGALMSKASLYTSSYLYGIIFKNDGTRVTKAPRIYFNRTVDSNDNVTEEFGALRWNGTNILRWDEEEITIDKPINITNNGLATDDQHAIHRGYVNKVGRMAGLQLGQYNYRRSSDSFNAGAIKSNTTTNPANITQISLYKNNYDGITFGQSFLLNLIVPKMYLHFMDKDSASYVGRIDEVYIISNGIQMKLTPMTGLISGSVYYNNKYDVTISYNKFGVNKYPQ